MWIIHLHLYMYAFRGYFYSKHLTLLFLSTISQPPVEQLRVKSLVQGHYGGSLVSNPQFQGYEAPLHNHYPSLP